MSNNRLLYLVCIPALVNIAAAGIDVSSECCGDADPKTQSRSSWTWVENCHVLKPHDLTDGTHYSFFAAYAQQSVLSGPRAEGKTRGDYLYFATVKQDLWQGGSLIVYGEGGRGKGIDPLLNGFLVTNGTIEEADIYISRFFLLNDFPCGRLQLIAGKIALSDFFDTSSVANCEIVQFLAGPLVNNPTIPFPDFGIGAALKASPFEGFYFQAGFADTKAKGTTTGFESAFGGNFKLFQIFEMGFGPHFGGRDGTYRFIYWRNPLSLNAEEEATSHDNDGWALSFDQQISDGLELFCRYGFANHPVSEMKHFWSAGGRLKGLLPERNRDFFELAVAQGISPGRLNESDETMIEADYSAHINESLTITPLMQIIDGPGTTVTAGVRVVWAF